MQKGCIVLTGKTHLTFGTAAAVLVTQPADWKSFLLCLGAGAIGSCVCDVDISTSDSHKGFHRFLLLLGIAVASIIVLDIVFQAGIWKMIQQKNGLLRSLIGLAMFLALCLYGERQPHRTFTHSLTGVALMGISVYVMLPQATWYFVCGMLSHIFLDLFNRKKIQLLFPLSTGKCCFRLCSADGVVNHVLFWFGNCLLATEVILAIGSTISIQI